MSEYSKAIAGAIAGAVVAFLSWTVVSTPHWSTLSPPARVVVLVVPAMIAGACVVFLAPRNQYPQG